MINTSYDMLNVSEISEMNHAFFYLNEPIKLHKDDHNTSSHHDEAIIQLETNRVFKIKSSSSFMQ